MCGSVAHLECLAVEVLCEVVWFDIGTGSLFFFYYVTSAFGT